MAFNCGNTVLVLSKQENAVPDYSFNNPDKPMAENKKSFVLYCDLIHTVKKMSNNKAGELFKTILSYVNDENPIVKDTVVDLVFEPVKQQLKRDLQKWDGERSHRSESGRIGGIKSGESRRSKANEASASKSKQTEANEAVSGNVSVNVSDNVKREVTTECIYDAEKEISGNQIQFEQILSTTKKIIDTPAAKISLRKFHLFLEERGKYPQTRKQIYAGFEKWLMNENNFINNGHQSTSKGGKHAGALQLVESLKQDYARGKENPGA